MKKISLLIIVYIIGLTFNINAEIITRDDVINTARTYVRIGNWTPVTDFTIAVTPTWHSWYKTEDNGGNPPYSRLSYCWSGFDNPEGFIGRVESQTNSVPAGGIGTDIYGYCRGEIAGIDCAGFVLRCWAFPDAERYDSWRDLMNVSMKIENNKTKKGDWINKIVKIVGTDTTTHQILCTDQIDNTHFNVYESTSYVDINNINDYPGVKYNPNIGIPRYKAYSPFPQFSSPKPEKLDIVYLDEQPTTIELTVCASGDIDNAECRVIVDEWGFPDHEIEVISSNETDDYIEYKITCEYVFEKEGFHTVKVEAGNDKSNVLVDRSSPVRTGC